MSENMIIGASPEGMLVAFDPALFGHDVIETADDFAEDAPREEEEESQNLRLRSGVMPIGHHRRYMANGGGCADHLDQTMRELYLTPEGLDRRALIVTAEKNGVMNPIWHHVNNGMLRMNLANRLRAVARRGKDITLCDGSGETLESGRFGIAPTTLEKLEHDRQDAAERKAAQAERQRLADEARAQRAAEIAARTAKGKPPVARTEQKVRAKTGIKGEDGVTRFPTRKARGA